ncbi:MAG TPA: galactokinase [Candidatus Dormibacteraeota bacterium]|nr:galactokinase [Candidatus Dormibacteraeota bacterium]
MIITRSPLRISLGGGGTDLPSYYRNHSGFVLSAAITQYVYITINEAFRPRIILKYSKLEDVARWEEIQHPIFREAMRLTGVMGPYIEIVSLSDIPAGTGLGSSGSFTTALLRALHTMKRNFVPPHQLAEQACHIEIDLLHEPVGKQDQYIAAFGGLTCFEFLPDDKVVAEPLKIAPEALANLEDNLLLFFTGASRSAAEVLRDQDTRTRENASEMLENLHLTKRLGHESRDALLAGDLRKFAEIMHVHWEHKKKRSPGMSSGFIDEMYELARSNGAIGGKLIGAGGGGFLLLYTEDKTRLRSAMRNAGLREVRLQFDFGGTSVLAHS